MKKRAQSRRAGPRLRVRPEFLAMYARRPPARPPPTTARIDAVLASLGACPPPPASHRAPLGTRVHVRVLHGVGSTHPLDAPESISVERSLVQGGRDVFGLTVQGDAMVGAGILHGDTVFVRAQQHAQPGALVVALVGDNAEVRYFYPGRAHVRLVPARASLAPVRISMKEWRPAMLLGVVIGLFRKLQPETP